MELEDTMDTYESEEDLAKEFGKPKSSIDKAKEAVAAKANEVKTGISSRIKEEQAYRAYKKEQAKKARLDFPTRYAKEQKRNAAAKKKRALRRAAIVQATQKATKELREKLQKAKAAKKAAKRTHKSRSKGRVTRQQTPTNEPFDLGFGGGGFDVFGGNRKGKPPGAFAIKSGGFEIFGSTRRTKKPKKRRQEFSIW